MFKRLAKWWASRSTTFEVETPRDEQGKATLSPRDAKRRLKEQTARRSKFRVIAGGKR